MAGEAEKEREEAVGELRRNPQADADHQRIAVPHLDHVLAVATEELDLADPDQSGAVIGLLEHSELTGAGRIPCERRVAPLPAGRQFTGGDQFAIRSEYANVHRIGPTVLVTHPNASHGRLRRQRDDPFGLVMIEPVSRSTRTAAHCVSGRPRFPQEPASSRAPRPPAASASPSFNRSSIISSATGRSGENPVPLRIRTVSDRLLINRPERRHVALAKVLLFRSRRAS